MDNRTVIVIAQTCNDKNADKIIVMEDGCIVESGTHESLM